jgi:ClpP class serine protease
MQEARKHSADFATPEATEAFIQTRSGRVARGEHMAIVDSKAVIPIIGVLTPRPDFFAAFFGGGNTVYGDIVAAIQQADGDAAVDEIALEISSPGGSISGMFDAMAAIADASKPVTAFVTDFAASAAFGLASQADKIVVKNPQTSVGSVGVVANVPVFEDIVTITSTEAPRKRPDVTTDKGVAMVRDELDAIHDEFVGAIAEGRGTTAKKVNQNFGQGGMLLAEAALAAGMIDQIDTERATRSSQSPAANSGGHDEVSANGGPTKEAPIMDLNKLKAEHPAVYAEAVKIGVDQERDRVSAHVIMGKSSGDMDYALKCVQEGSEMTATATATYNSAAMNRNDATARGEDNVTDVNLTNADADDLAATDKKVAAHLAENLGLEMEG